MKTTQIALAVLAAAFVAGASAQTNVYKWTDKDGNVHFSDAPPPADAKDATQKRMGGGDTENSSLPYATQVAAKRNPVDIYTTSDCGDTCKQARELLENRGVPYTEHDPRTSGADQEALKKLVGALYVPTITVGGTTIKGFEEQQWHDALDSAGYPRTRLPGQAPLRKSAEEASAK